MSQPWGYSCKGGLNVNLNQLEMLQQPGFATRLRNFEVDPDGGYRRIDGFTPFGDTKPNGSEAVLGMAVYADGVIVCSGTGIFLVLMAKKHGCKSTRLLFIVTVMTTELLTVVQMPIEQTKVVVLLQSMRVLQITEKL
jgi:hypothetical protein